MKFIRKLTAVLLTLVLVSGSFVCFAANNEKQHLNYDQVLLLGDSQASGFVDYGYVMSEFTYVPDSYAAYVANDLNAELIPMACPGFRTIELRYMLDDDYRPTDDPYLFAQVPVTPEDEIMKKVPAMRQAIKDSDLIMIGIGGNDWGAYLGWVMGDVQLENNLPDEYREALIEFLTNATVKDNTIEKIVELANVFNALDELIAALPEALDYALSNLRTNWEYIVEYIYENNPDVTLAVVGMFPTYLKTEEGAPDIVAEPDPAAILVEDAIIDFGNKHMIEGQKKYGYLFVDTSGTIVESAHQTPAGHRHIADRILEALPDARFICTADVPITAPYYKAVEYMFLNNIIEGTSDTTFSPDSPITKDVLSKALNKITGNYKTNDNTGKVSNIYMAISLLFAAEKKDIISFFRLLTFTASIITSYNFNITRAEASEILYTFIQSYT